MSDSATPWTVADQAPLSMEFSRQEYWSGLLFPSPGDLPYPGIEPRSPTLQADPLISEPPGRPRTELSRSVVSDSLRPRGLQPTRLLHPWVSLGKNTGVGYHFLLQGIFLIQGSNPGLPCCRQTL